MPIDTTTETIISLADAARRLPGRRAGKKPRIETLYRWTAHGCRGVVLESVQIGGTRCTSVEALDRYFAALTAQAMPGTPPAPPTTRLSAARRRQVEKAQRELAAAGI